MNTHEIQQYWENRAKATPNNATTNDIHLRELEFNTLKRAILQSQHSPKTILDIGCGDGATTLKLAAAYPDRQFAGWDYSPTMIELAKRIQEASGAKNCQFYVKDFTTCPFEYFDLVIASRVFINIPTWEEQKQALKTAIGLGKGLIAIENFAEEQENFERARELNGLPVIKVHSFNKYLREYQLIQFAFDIGSPITISNFANAYYYATRICYAKQCQFLYIDPCYTHPAHQSAVKLQEISSPNIAPMKLIVM
jgi:SAM-dependent methyltransferase